MVAFVREKYPYQTTDEGYSECISFAGNEGKAYQFEAIKPTVADEVPGKAVSKLPLAIHRVGSRDAHPRGRF